MANLSESEIGKLRERITAAFCIRGTSSKYPLGAMREEADRTRSYHRYWVPTDADIPHAQFMNLLKATISAAVARGMEHTQEVGRRNWTTWDKVPHEVEIRFESEYSDFTVGETKLHYRAFEPGPKTRHVPHRPQYETALVNGKVCPTFQETRTFEQQVKPWFSIRLTKKEAQVLHSQAMQITENSTEHSHWEHKPVLDRMAAQGFDKPLEWTSETSLIPHASPYDYVIYELARRKLVNKALTLLKKEARKLPR